SPCSHRRPSPSSSAPRTTSILADRVPAVMVPAVFGTFLARLFSAKIPPALPCGYPFDTLWMPCDQGQNHPRTEAFYEIALFLREECHRFTVSSGPSGLN